MHATYYNQFLSRRRSTVINVDGQYPIDMPNWRRQHYEVICFHHPEDQRLIFIWFDGWRYKHPYRVEHAMGVRLEYTRTPDHRERGWAQSKLCLFYLDEYEDVIYPHWRPRRHQYAAGDYFPGGDWPGALLSISRSIAAGRAEPLNFLGWIEDNMPEPWSLLATPEPLEAFRQLSPLPLYPEGD